jgi:hypothetical protein
MSWTSDPSVVLAVAGGIATVGTFAYVNRREIARIKDSIWGPERSTDGGLDQDVDTLADQMGRIETKLDNERASRNADHRSVEQEIRTNRYLVVASVNGLVEAINDEADSIEIDEDDVRPDWISDDDFEVDPFDASDD